MSVGSRSAQVTKREDGNRNSQKFTTASQCLLLSHLRPVPSANTNTSGTSLIRKGQLRGKSNVDEVADPE